MRIFDRLELGHGHVQEAHHEATQSETVGDHEHALCDLSFHLAHQGLEKPRNAIVTIGRALAPLVAVIEPTVPLAETLLALHVGVAVVDLTKTTLPVSRYPLGNAQGVPGVPRYGPYSVALVPGSSDVLVANLEANDLRVFDLATRTFRANATIHLGAKAFMPAAKDATTAYVPLQAPDSLVRVDLSTGKVATQVVKSPDECKAPHAFGIEGTRVFVVCEGDHKGPGTVLEVDPVSLVTKRKWTVGVYPDGFAFGR